MTASGESLTIDELARHTGMTVRNIRAHQSRGLLPGPELRGRTGYYGSDHVARIELIQKLQGEGFNLEAIRRLIESADGSGDEMVRFTREFRQAFEDESPRAVTLRELTERFGNHPELLERAVELGVFRRREDGTIEERSPRLSRVAAELADVGIPLETTLEVAARLRRHTEGIAGDFVALFLEQVWEPFARAGHPDERWQEVRAALERLRPLAADSLVGVFRLAMTDAVEEAFRRELPRLERDVAGKDRG